MVNLILKFTINKTNKDQLVAFDNKKVHFICNDSKESVKPGDIWECFLWTGRDKFNLVKPFKKINPDDLEKEKKRVADFNKEVSTLEKKVNDDFKKVIFDENNKPYLWSNLTTAKTKEKYPMFIIKKIKDRVAARPIMTAEDRVEWRQNQHL